MHTNTNPAIGDPAAVDRHRYMLKCGMGAMTWIEKDVVTQGITSVGKLIWSSSKRTGLVCRNPRGIPTVRAYCEIKVTQPEWEWNTKAVCFTKQTRFDIELRRGRPYEIMNNDSVGPNKLDKVNLVCSISDRSAEIWGFGY